MPALALFLFWITGNYDTLKTLTEGVVFALSWGSGFSEYLSILIMGEIVFGLSCLMSWLVKRFVVKDS